MRTQESKKNSNLKIQMILSILKVQVAISFIALLWLEKSFQLYKLSVAFRFKEEGIQNDLKILRYFSPLW